MARIGNTATISSTGIKFSGKIVSIDMEKYGNQLMDFFRSHGMEEKATKSMYGPKFRANIEQGKKERSEGKLTTLDLNNIWD